jgi:hypothetical protein
MPVKTAGNFMVIGSEGERIAAFAIEGDAKAFMALPGILASCRAALAFIKEESENRSEAGSEYSDYEREPRELAEQLAAVISMAEGR